MPKRIVIGVESEWRPSESSRLEVCTSFETSCALRGYVDSDLADVGFAEPCGSKHRGRRRLAVRPSTSGSPTARTGPDVYAAAAPTALDCPQSTHTAVDRVREKFGSDAIRTGVAR